MTATNMCSNFVSFRCSPPLTTAQAKNIAIALAMHNHSKDKLKS